MTLRCAVALLPEQQVGVCRAQCPSAVTELTSYVEFHFNNNGLFIIRPVIFTVVVSIQHGQNARQGQRCKENRGT
jgi:hypothetical protein